MLILTTIHHIYGALLYATPWRYHAAAVAIPTLLVLIAAYEVRRRNPRSRAGTIAAVVFVVLTLAVPIALIGFFEGGYNHVLKNILYFGGASKLTLVRLFPPPKYEMPNDWVFEITGVAQFPAAVWTTVSLGRLAFRRLRS